MANAVLYRLHFRSPLHVGERGVGLEETRTHVPADTLFSAICSAWRWLYGAETLQSDLLAPFLHGEQPPFLLSSAFPFAGEVLFFPKPLSPVKMEPQQHTDYNHKRLKNIRYVSRERFAQWVQGQAIPYASFPEEEEPVFWLSEEERGVLSSFVDDETGHLRLWSVTVVPRVTLDRQTSASQIWFFGLVVCRPLQRRQFAPARRSLPASAGRQRSGWRTGIRVRTV
jgi:CRISPR-associated protein Csm4